MVIAIEDKFSPFTGSGTWALRDPAKDDGAGNRAPLRPAVVEHHCAGLTLPPLATLGNHGCRNPDNLLWR